MRLLPLSLLLLAGCIDAATPIQPGGPAGQPAAADGVIEGRVLSKELGVMPGVTVRVGPSGALQTTDEFGRFTFTSVARTAVTVELVEIPAMCERPAPQAINLALGTPSRVRFLVSCSVAQG